MNIRRARITDAEAIRAIYAPAVAQTAISFEEMPPDRAEMAQRIAATLPDYPYLVAEGESGVLGFAYAGPYRERAAFRATVEVAIYVAREGRGRGVGRTLYAALLGAAGERGFHAAIAVITLPNPGSVALHEAMGFAAVGVQREVGRKFGRWHDVGFWQLML